MAAQIGYGATVTVGGGAVGDPTMLSWSGCTSNAVNVNTLTQSSQYDQHIGGMRNGGTISVEALWNSASYATLVGYNGLLKDIVFTIGTVTYTWDDALVTKVGELSVPIDDKVTAKFEFQANGPPTVGTAS